MKREPRLRWGFVAWLLILGGPVVAGLLWQRADYPDVGILVALPRFIATLATIAWGYVLGRLKLWRYLIYSAPIGAAAFMTYAAIAERIEPSGGENNYVVLNFLIFIVILGVLLGLGSQVALATRRMGTARGKP